MFLFLHLMFLKVVFFVVWLLQELPDWKDFNEVLLWIVAGGAAVVVNAFFTFLAENFAWWHNLKSTVKLLISLVLSVLIGAGAYYLLSLPDIITFIQPYWAILVTIFLAWLGSQAAYLFAKSRGYAQKAIATAAKKK